MTDPEKLSSDNSDFYSSDSDLEETSSTNIKTRGTKVVKEDYYKLLRNASLNLWVIDRICVLQFCTVTLKPELKYGDEKIIGFQSYNGKCGIYAERALIFLIHGLYNNWKQLISFVFFGKELTPEILSKSIKDVLNTCFLLKFKVVATVCEHNEENINAFNEIKRKVTDDIEYESFLYDHREIVILYDTNSLLKNVQNELMQNDIKYTKDNVEYTAKWEHILKYVNESDIKTIKIFFYKFCSNIINDNDEEIKYTGNFLQLFCEIYDSLNGKNSNNNNNNNKRPLKQIVTIDSDHFKYWSKHLQILKTIKIMENEPICIKNWIHTLSGIMHLWKNILQPAKFKSFSPIYLNLVELHNICELKSKTKLLTPFEFYKSFKEIITTCPDEQLPLCDATRSLLLSKFEKITINKTNIEDCRILDMTDNCRPLLTEPDFENFSYDPVLHFQKTKICDDVNNMGETFPVNNAKKSFLKRIYEKLKSDCIQCNKIYFGQEKYPETNTLLISDSFLCKAFDLIADQIIKKFPDFLKNCNHPHFVDKLKTIITDEIDLKFLNCGEHDNKSVILQSVDDIIMAWTWKINRYLRGKDVILHQNMSQFAKQAILIGRKKTDKQRTTFSVHVHKK